MALRGRRDDVVLATKLHSQWGDGINTRGSSRRWIFAEVGNSLDELVPPGVTLNRADEGWLPPWPGGDAGV